MRPLPLLAAVAAAAALVGCSTSYHAGDEAARQWDSWVKDHPLAGARVTDRVGTNVQPFQGSFEAYARLTATPSEDAIVKAMASMCRFDKVTGSSTTYWLQIDRISLQAPCDHDGQTKDAAFWTAVKDLPGIVDLAFSSKGVGLTADDAHLTALVPPVSAAADATGHAGSKSENTYTSDRITITQTKGADLSTELGFAQGVLDAAGKDLTKMEVLAGRVSADTTGSVDQAHQWQQDVGQGSDALTVVPAHVETEVAYTNGARDLVDRLSTDSRVLKVTTIKPFWEIETKTTDDARALITLLDGESAKSDLGRLQLDVGPSDYDSAKGTGRTCFVRPDFAKPTHAAALLDLCDLKSAVEVDDRFDAALDLRLHSTDLKPMLAALKRAPYGLPVYLQLPQNETVEFTTGATLKQQYPDADSSKKLEQLWESLP